MHTLCCGSVIAVVKDVPDVGGDRRYEIKTLSVRLGARTMMAWGTKLLSATMLLAAAGCLYTSAAAGGLLRIARVGVAAAGVAAAVWVQRSSADLLRRGVDGAGDVSGGVEGLRREEEWSKEAFKYYMDLWKLFYGAYLLLPFAL